jgi:hypothetical protein
MEAQMDAYQEKMDDGQEEIKAKVSSLAFRIDVNQEEMKTILDACLEKMEANAGELQFVAELPKEEAAVKPVGALKKRKGDQHLAPGRRRKPKKRTQGSVGSRKKLAVVHRGMTRRAGLARRKGHCREGHGRNNVARGTLKTRTFGKRRRAKPEGTNGIRTRDLKEWPRLGSEKTSGGIYRKALRVEIMQRIAGSFVRIRKVRDWTLRREWPLPKRKRICTQIRNRKCRSTGYST